MILNNIPRDFPVISPPFLTTVLDTEVDLAEVVVEAEVFPRILHCLRDVDETLGKRLEVTACFAYGSYVL